MNQICVPQTAPHIHGKPAAPIRRKRQSLDFQALMSKNKANHSHRLSQQLPVPSDHFKGSLINLSKPSVDLGAKETDTVVRVSLSKGSESVDERGIPKVSRHKASRSIEADDITGFWSRRLTAQKRTVALKPPVAADNTQSFRSRTFSSSAINMSSTTQSPPPNLVSAPKASPALVSDSSSTTSIPPLNRTLRRKATLGPPPPPKDRHTLRTRGSTSKSNIRPATSPQVSAPRKSKSAPLQSLVSAPNPISPENGSLRPSSSPKDSLPFPSTQADVSRDDKYRSAKLFPPITFGRIVSSITRRSPSAPTTPSLPVSTDQDRSRSETSLNQQSEKAMEEKVDRDRRRKTGLEQIVVDAGRDKHTYTKESETEEVLRVLEQLRKLRAA